MCLADISTQNANVMYELGYALASNRDVVIICAKDSGKFPFNIQHRAIINYGLGTEGDFKRLQQTITDRLTSILRQQEERKDAIGITSMTVTPKEGGGESLEHHEITTLAILLATTDSPSDTVPGYTIKTNMNDAGFTDVATRLSLARLCQLNLAASTQESDYNGNVYSAYTITDLGQQWLLDNRHLLKMTIDRKERKRSKTPPQPDNDIPF